MHHRHPPDAAIVIAPGGARPMAGRTVLVTGATRGIGYATADALARMGAKVIVHGRDKERVRSACFAIAQSALHAEIQGAVADLSSLDEVRQLARDVEAQNDRLDVLINNAGIVTRKREETVDGHERQLAVNHLAPFVLTHALLHKLRSTPGARIVNVASNAHRRAAFDLGDLNWEQRRYSGVGAYGATKLANILFTRHLAGRLDGTGVTANCLHPGVVATNIFTGLGLFGKFFGILTKPLLLSSERGAQTSIFLAASDEAAGFNGKFFDRKQPVSPAPAALDDVAAERLWHLSEELTGHVG